MRKELIQLPIFWHDGEQFARVPLTQGQEAIIDACDAGWVGERLWHAAKINGLFYAVRRAPGQGGRHLFLHRVVYKKRGGQIDSGKVVDHFNQDSLDDRFLNLRVVTHSFNLANGTPKRRVNFDLPKGVHPSTGGKFRARLRVGGCKVHLGTFLTPEEASVAFEIAHKNLYPWPINPPPEIRSYLP